MEYLLAAVAAGAAARWQGRAVEALGLRGCTALSDAALLQLCDSMPALRCGPRTPGNHGSWPPSYGLRPAHHGPRRT